MKAENNIIQVFKQKGTKTILRQIIYKKKDFINPFF